MAGVILGGVSWSALRRVAGRVVVAAWLALTAQSAAAQAPAELSITKSTGERRVALVIGNGAYQAGPVLANPVNDARAMATKLKKVGFEVIEVENGGQQMMLRAIAQFSNKLGGDTVSLFYYAGHGIQVSGKNYLIPTDAEITTEQTVRLATVDVDSVIEQMSMAKSRVNLVILDACRSNPFERRFRSVSGGLASIDAPTGTMIAYATSPGKVAADGDSGNGLYTSELIKAIDVAGAKVEDTFKRVRANVIERSGGAQTPWEASSLTGDFYFTSPPAPIAPAPAPGGVDREVVLWTSVKDTRNPAILQTYLDQFPQGMFAATAKLMIDDLKKAQIAVIPAKPDVAPTPPADTGPAIEDVEDAYITVKRANLREKPAADAKLVKALDAGVPLTVTGKVKGTEWFRVATADGRLRGFVFGDAIQDIKAAEEADWQRVKDAKQSAVVAGFLRRFPSGAYADQAKALRDDLAKSEQATLILAAEQKAEADRQAEEKRKAEEVRKAEEARRAEEQRQAALAEAKRQAEEKRKAEEERAAAAQRATEAQRLADEARRAEEQRKAEAQRLVDEQARHRAEAERAADAQRQAEATRRLEEQRKAAAAEEERKRAEAERQAALAEQQRQAREADARRQAEATAPSPQIAMATPTPADLSGKWHAEGQQGWRVEAVVSGNQVSGSVLCLGFTYRFKADLVQSNPSNTWAMRVGIAGAQAGGANVPASLPIRVAFPAIQIMDRVVLAGEYCASETLKLAR